ncbi:hypothetical protein M8C21_000601, partial [Ambrosia artemisiifolia]
MDQNPNNSNKRDLSENHSSINIIYTPPASCTSSVMSLNMSAVYGVVAVAVAVAVVVYGWRLLNWVWLRPKAIEKSLREQGLNGNRYKFLFGDLKEMVRMTHEAKLKPIKLTDSIVPRVMPFHYTSAKTYGTGSIFFTWLGPRPLVHVTEPPLIRQILANYNQFQKPRGGNPLTKMLARGLADVDADQWVKHRKIINPAFHVEKLKHMLPAFHISCSEMINKWEGMTKGGSCEVDVYPHLQTMTSDVISRTAFGSSYEEGRRIFELQVEQAKLVIKAAQSMYIPGSRSDPLGQSGSFPHKYNVGDRSNVKNLRDRIDEIVVAVVAVAATLDDGGNGFWSINMILYEVLRLYPPGIGMERMIHEETKIGNLLLPSGSHLMLHLMLLHYDAYIWGDDVNEFKPE